MLKKMFLVNLLVMVLLFGMVVVGCNDGPPSGGGGTLTVTGIPEEYNGKYAVFMGDGDVVSLIGAKTVNPDGKSGTAVQIANGKVSLPMWTMAEDETIVRYSGNDTVEGELMIFATVSVGEGTEPIDGIEFDSVVFKKGNATITWSDGSGSGPSDPSGSTNGTLTVTGIPAEYNGKYILFMSGSEDEGGEGEGGEPQPGDVFILGAQSVDADTMSATLVQIQNGSASLHMYKLTFTTEGINSADYAGTESLTGELTISETSTTSPDDDTSLVAGKKFASIQFTNGSATISWGEGIDINFGDEG